MRGVGGEAALEALSNGRIVDVVFSDVMMAGTMNGIALAHEIRRRRPDIPVIMTSGYAGSPDESAGLEGLRLLTKPYALSALEQALHEAVSASA